MKTIRLSDHAQVELDRREAGRIERHQRALAEYDAIRRKNREDYAERSRKHEARMRELGERLHTAWRDRKYLRAAGLGFLTGVTGVFGRPGRESDPRRPEVEPPDEQDEIWKAGRAGELAVERALSESLDDSWSCLRGFHGARGEVDILLVGPAGVAAIEVKNINGRITCSGDTWTRDKYDAYGNRVEAGIPVRDRGGRSPSRQLVDAAGWIEIRLGRKFRGVRIHKIIVLTHSRSQIEHVENLTVEELVHLRDWDIAETVVRMGGSLEESAVGEIVKCVTNLHGVRAWSFFRLEQMLGNEGKSNGVDKKVPLRCVAVG